MAREVRQETSLARRPSHRACRHDWQLVSDDVDEFGAVRMFECPRCGRVRFT